MAKAKADAADDSDMNKTDMVKAALADLGLKAKPLAIQAHIKEKYNTEMTKATISNYKSVLKRRGALKGIRRPRGRKPGMAASLQIEHFEQIRTLVRQLGADQVKRLIAVVG